MYVHCIIDINKMLFFSFNIVMIHLVALDSCSVYYNDYRYRTDTLTWLSDR